MKTGTRIAGDWFDRPVPPNVVIHDGAWVISAHVFLRCRSRMDPAVVIGSSSGIYEGCSFVLGPAGQVRIGAFCQLVDTIVSTNSSVTVGDHALFAFGTVLTDSPFGCIAAEDGDGRDGGSGAITIGDNVWLGARSVILGGSTIGDDAVIGAGSVVEGHVPPGALAAGNPLRLIGQVR